MLAHEDGLTPVINTSRQELVFYDQTSRLASGDMVSAFMMGLEYNLSSTIDFLIIKGGVTSNDVLSSGLALLTLRVPGQLLPGCSVVRCLDCTHVIPTCR